MNHILPDLVSANIIDFEDQEEIRDASKTSFAAAAMLLSKLAAPLQCGSTIGFYELLNMMKTNGTKADQDLAKCIESDLQMEELNVSCQMYTCKG